MWNIILIQCACLRASTRTPKKTLLDSTNRPTPRSVKWDSRRVNKSAGKLHDKTLLTIQTLWKLCIKHSTNVTYTFLYLKTHVENDKNKPFKFFNNRELGSFSLQRITLYIIMYRVNPNIHRSEEGCLSPSVAGAPWTIPWFLFFLSEFVRFAEAAVFREMRLE